MKSDFVSSHRGWSGGVRRSYRQRIWTVIAAVVCITSMAPIPIAIVKFIWRAAERQ